MKTLLADFRIRRLLLANITGSIGVGITLITIPWLLVQQPGGERYYGWVTIISTIVLFAFAPYYGAWLDRHSRKTALLLGEAFGAVTALVMTIWILVTGETATWQLLVLFFCGMLYYTLHYPAKFAFVQQIFERRHYQQLMGLLEIQGQTASMLAGGLASLLIDRVPFGLILLCNSATYVFSFFVQRTLPYVATHLKAGSDGGSAGASFMVGLRWLGARPGFTTFIICAYAPFVAVMVGNYLFPIYVQNVLQAPAAVYGRGEVAFAGGAILAGLLVPRLLAARPPAGVALLMMGLFLVGLALLGSVPSVLAFYVALLLLGLGNAGARVARGSVLLHEVPNEIMGRVNVVIAAADRILRTLLLFGAMAVVARADATLAFGGLMTFIGLALLLAWINRKALQTGSPAAPGLPAG
ncbi:MAG TPA: MFS transporter [Opitutaceae bacterium]|nr:MFS transporter [Opitutaceae bacterium]HRJ46630.1 MFS transporter [Opitutaceae bacterium]